MEDTDLILLVQAQEGLYNKRSFAFQNKAKKAQVWNDISKELGVDVEMCMKRWINLRERFSKELRYMKEQNDDGSHKVQRWPLYEYMLFLEPHIVKRNRTPELYPPRTFTTPKVSKVELDPIETVPSTLRRTPRPIHISELSSCSEIPAVKEVSQVRKRKNEDDAVENAANAIAKLCEKRLKVSANNELEKFGTMLITMMESLEKSKQLRLMVTFMEQVANARLEDDNARHAESLVEEDFQNM